MKVGREAENGCGYWGVGCLGRGVLSKQRGGAGKAPGRGPLSGRLNPDTNQGILRPLNKLLMYIYILVKITPQKTVKKTIIQIIGSADLFY